MKKLLLMLVIVIAGTIAPMQKAVAQDPITEIIKAGVIKVIKAVDLQVQRFQNETIWLQNAQKVVENKMSKLKLTEISDWVEKQKKLYSDYFNELGRVKSGITYYHRIKEITAKQILLFNEYKRAFALFKRDTNFSLAEINYMGRVYSGIIDKSIENIEKLSLVIHSSTTTMTDAKRLEIIDAVANEEEEHYGNLKAFNTENILLSLKRSKEQSDIDNVRKLYGL